MFLATVSMGASIRFLVVALTGIIVFFAVAIASDHEACRLSSSSTAHAQS